MKIVFLTALGVGGATVIGAVLGFVFKKNSHRFSDITLGFAAGVMLAAAIIGLILPSLGDGIVSLIVTIAGVFCGALCLNFIDRLTPHLHKLVGVDSESHPDGTSKLNKVLLFVLAIAIHNIPEGIAAGVGFGAGSTSDALAVAGGIALQNIPEGMVIIAPMLAAGISKKRTFIAAAATGLVEVLGTFVGYFAASISSAVLPFILAFAGGTMLPETHSHGNERGATYSLLVGFCLMLVMDTLIG